MRRSTFKSWQSYHEFAWDVRRGGRFIHSPSTRRFLDTVLATSESRQLDMPRGTELFRAQLDGRRDVNRRGGLVSHSHVVGPHEAERMKPLFDRAREGRVNPAGIPCLYLASDATTAIAESRPWPGRYVSLGLFVVHRDVKLLDCSRDLTPTRVYMKEPPPTKRAKAVWRDINDAFARPVSGDEQRAEYVPTQTLSELFRSAGFEGIVFKSSCAPGHNVVLFNLLMAELARCTLCTVESVKYEYCYTGAIYSTAVDPAIHSVST